MRSIAQSRWPAIGRRHDRPLASPSARETVERQRAFARTRWPTEDAHLFARQLDRDVFEVVLASSLNGQKADALGRGLRDRLRLADSLSLDHCFWFQHWSQCPARERSG